MALEHSREDLSILATFHTLWLTLQGQRLSVSYPSVFLASNATFGSLQSHMKNNPGGMELRGGGGHSASWKTVFESLKLLVKVKIHARTSPEECMPPPAPRSCLGLTLRASENTLRLSRSRDTDPVGTDPSFTIPNHTTAGAAS